MGVCLQRGSESFVCYCIFSSRNIFEIPRGGYYHPSLQLGKGTLAGIKQSVQTPSLAGLKIQSLPLENSLPLGEKLS
jgi:hypothetical protein